MANTSIPTEFDPILDQLSEQYAKELTGLERRSLKEYFRQIKSRKYNIMVGINYIGKGLPEYIKEAVFTRFQQFYPNQSVFYNGHNGDRRLATGM